MPPSVQHGPPRGPRTAGPYPCLLSTPAMPSRSDSAAPPRTHPSSSSATRRTAGSMSTAVFTE